MSIKIILTIDDGPSIHTDKKVAFLIQNKIPAIFYVRGEYVEMHPDQVVLAIKNGFLVGNHSYSHPYFSAIPLEQCFQEVLMTEDLINQCYEAAQEERKHKIIRLPFGDRGSKTNTNADIPDKNKEQKIQSFLQEQGFVSLDFQDDGFIDANWDWDAQDYKAKHVENLTLYKQNMVEFLNDYNHDTAVLLVHDFDWNHHLFEATMDFLIDPNAEFLNYT